MLSSFLHEIEPLMFFIYSAHILLSFIIAYFLSFYISGRFRSRGDDIMAKDRERLDKIQERSVLFKFLFQASLERNNALSSFLFFSLFNLSLPIIGYMISIWVVWYLRNIKYDKKVTNTNILNLDEFGISFLNVERIFGEGSMAHLLKNKYAPKSKKLKALSSLAASRSPANLRIIRQTLSSNDDEIRMFGYAIINKIEKNLSTKINHYLTLYNEEKLKEKNSPEIVANAAMELAFLYWEMVYTELSHDSLKDNFLEEVIKYATFAKEFYLKSLKESNNPNTLKSLKDEKLMKVYVLLGRVYMSKKEYSLASTEFTIAQELHASNSSYILPYLAEVHFLQGNYKVVNSILQEATDLGLNATLFSVVEQWRSS